MSEIYVLVKQVEGQPNGVVTLHGTTENEDIADTWNNAGENNISFYVAGVTPSFEHYEWEEADAE